MSVLLIDSYTGTCPCTSEPVAFDKCLFCIHFIDTVISPEAILCGCKG